MEHNNKLPFLSVIVPIYKVEKYLVECIESVRNQSFEDFELILVDDGSPDNCPQICDDYCQKDSRIHVIHKKNGGLVEARRTGINAAKGQYTVFVDGDDWIDENLLENAKEILTDEKVDIIAFNYYRNSLAYEEICKHHIPAGYYTGDRKKYEVCAKMMCTGKYFEFGLVPSIATKVFRTALIREMLMKVDGRITMGEDAAVSYPAILKANTIVVSSKAFYHYREVQDSMSLKYNPKYFEKIEILMDWFEKKEIDVLKEQLPLYKLMLLEEGLLRVLIYSESFLGAISEVKRICQQERYRRLLDDIACEQINDEKKKLILILKNRKYYMLYIMFLSTRLKRKLKKILRK